MLVAVAGIWVFVTSEAFLHRKYEVTRVDVAIPSDAAAVAEGRRLASIRGCFGCHGPTLQGEVFYDDFLWGRSIAPNLTDVAERYSSAELASAIREGVRANGESLQDMPSPMFFNLSDADLGSIIGFLRSANRVSGPAYHYRPGLAARWEMAKGQWVSIASEVRTLGPRMPEPSPDDSLARGEYLARTACSECHGNGLSGGATAPDLRIVIAYSFDDFGRLMREGIATGERELPMMSPVARNRFSHFTEAELRTLHRFLMSRVEGG